MLGNGEDEELGIVVDAAHERRVEDEEQEQILIAMKIANLWINTIVIKLTIISCVYNISKI
jgi:hypothetical protein